MSRIYAAILLALFLGGCRNPPPPDMPVERMADAPPARISGIGSQSNSGYGPYKF